MNETSEESSTPTSCQSLLRRKDLSGQQFGGLTVLYLDRQDSQYRLFYRCKCHCGTEFVVRSDAITTGKVTECRKHYKRPVSHGHAIKGAHTRIYNGWKQMIQRCTNPKHAHFKNYGGRGITVCPEWMKFENFLADMGPKPEGLTLERNDNDKGYFKENCRWATRSEQQNNRRTNHIVELDGIKDTLTNHSRRLGIPYEKLRHQIRYVKRR